MKVKLLNSSDYHNMYGLIDDEGRTVGTKEVQLMTGSIKYAAWARGYTAAKVKKGFMDAEQAQKGPEGSGTDE